MLKAELNLFILKLKMLLYTSWS